MPARSWIKSLVSDRARIIDEKTSGARLKRSSSLFVIFDSFVITINHNYTAVFDAISYFCELIYFLGLIFFLIACSFLDNIEFQWPSKRGTLSFHVRTDETLVSLGWTVIANNLSRRSSSEISWHGFPLSAIERENAKKNNYTLIGVSSNLAVFSIAIASVSCVLLFRWVTPTLDVSRTEQVH